MSPGAAHAPSARHHAVVSPGARRMKKLRQRTSLALSPGLTADASSSDLASHHTWREPSASDLTIKNWRSKRVIERTRRRNLDPFEEGARLEAAREVTGPCGCTLAFGDRSVANRSGDTEVLGGNSKGGTWRCLENPLVSQR